MERHNDNLEMRFDYLARVDEDDIDLRILSHVISAVSSAVMLLSQR